MHDTREPRPQGDYRPDIDGLRAVAVLAVILFHVDPRWLPGGFVGVDIFFVISGYLITGIIAREQREGRFTLARFYERRVRRILPALWLLLIVCVPLSWLVLLPADAEAMGKSALWSALAMANVYFWREASTDYFAPQSAQLPFLHLWSLGVEEQFYLLWPAALLAVWRFARPRAEPAACVLALLVVLASTLAAEAWLAAGATRFAYYMLPARAGELALGAALALVRLPASGTRGTAAAANVAAAVGWGLLACSVFGLNEHDPFPGWRALLPTAGGAALILSGRWAPAGAALAPLRWAPSLWLGRCSYSAYLWHWPVLAWWRYLWGQPGVVAGLLLMALILVLARASQRWVEDPVRRARGSLLRTLAMVVVTPALLVAMLAMPAARGERWGLPLYSQADRKAWQQLETYVQPAHRVRWVCQQQVLDAASLTDPACELGTGEGPARALLFGDSHAAEFAPALRIAAEAQGVRMRSVALGSCAPLAGPLHGVVAASRVDACEQGMRLVLERARDFPLLIVGAAWDRYAANDPAVWARLESQLQQLTARGHRVWLLPRSPELDGYDAACPAKRVRVGAWLECPAALAPRDLGAQTHARLAALAARVPGVRFLPLHEPLCGAASCPVADAQGHYLYADPSHLSVHGSRHLAAQWMREQRMPDLSGRSDR